MQLLAKFKKILYMGFRAILNFRNDFNDLQNNVMFIILLMRAYSLFLFMRIW